MSSITNKLMFIKPNDHDDDDGNNQQEIISARVYSSLNTTSATDGNFNDADIRLKCCRKIVYGLEKYQIIILATERMGIIDKLQLPQYLLEMGWHTKGIIGIVQPLIDPAISLAEKLIYDQKFNEAENTKVKSISEETLIQELFHDPLLTSYGIIILDEVYKRTILTDTIMALLKKIIRKRLTIKVILVSNNQEVELIEDYFKNSSKIVPSKSVTTSCNNNTQTVIFDVDEDMNTFQYIYYLQKPCPNYVNKSVEVVMKIHQEQPIGGGDIIVYLADIDEISDAIDQLKNYLSSEHIKNLNYFKFCQMKNERQSIFFPKTDGVRNVIFTTKLYQHTVIQDRINYVIDSGFMEVEWFLAEEKRYQKLVVPICKFTASLRAKWWSKYNRCAKIFRLYTEEEFAKLPERSLVEMRHANLTTLVLCLKTLAVDNILRFDFPSPPPAKNLLSALETLNALEALNEQGDLIDPLGYFMADAPFPPMTARLLFKANEFHCTKEILTIVAMLQVEPIFIVTTNNAADSHKQVAKRIFEAAEGDLITLLNVYTAFMENGKSKEFCRKYYLSYRHLIRAVTLRDHLICHLLNKYKLKLTTCGMDIEKILRCITSAYFMNVAYLHPSGSYRSLRFASELFVDRDSSIFTLAQPKYLVYCDLWEKSQKLFMQNVTVIKEEWLEELAPHYYTKST